MTAHPSTRSGEPLTRRGLLTGVGALGGLVALSACSNTDPFAIDRASGGYSGGPIIIGSQQYYSNEIIAELSAQMLEKAGLTVTRATAQAHSLTSIADLASLGRPITIAANSEFTTRPYGPEGLKAVYGGEASVTPVEDSGGPLTVKALTDGTVDVADIYSSDPVIQTQDLVVLSDPQMLILPQNVTPLVSASLPAIAVTAINRVSALLTPDELRALNQRSTGEGLRSKVIATDWLTSKKLL